MTPRTLRVLVLLMFAGGIVFVVWAVLSLLGALAASLWMWNATPDSARPSLWAVCLAPVPYLLWAALCFFIGRRLRAKAEQAN